MLNRTTGKGDSDSPACIKPVRILSVSPAPPIEPVRVGLHYLEGGNWKHEVVNNFRPTYFDEVVVSSVSEMLPAFQYPVAAFSSAKNMARGAVALARQARAAAVSPIVYSEPVLDLRFMVPSNIAHLMCDIIPYALLAREVAGPDVKLLLQPVRGPFLKLLEHFGLAPTWEDRRVTGEIIKISGTRGLAVYDLTRTFDCNGVHFAPEVLLRTRRTGTVAGLGFERIFLARRAPRNLRNQAEIETITNQHGYKTIFMEDYAIEEQLSIAAEARHVIAVHGAAMALLLVNRGLRSVVELLPANVYHQMFVTCLGRRVARYEQIVPEYDVRVPHSGWEAIVYYKNRNFGVDEQLLERLLTEIHASPDL